MQDRHYGLEAVSNFRDFGGYLTASGRQVARGRLFRAAHFHEPSPGDIARLNALGVKFMVDLRRQHECNEMPNRWAAPRVIFYDPQPQEHSPWAMLDDYTPDIARAAIMSVYDRYPNEERFITLFRTMFAGLAEEGGPMVVHCAAGKDRTGIACALVLSALGVDREIIFEDYELTNRLIDRTVLAERVRARLEPRLGRRVEDAALNPIVSADRSYLETAFAAMEREAGSLEAYLEKTLGVDASLRARIHAHLLTD